MSQTQRSRATGVVAIVLGVLLAALMVYPWPQHTPTPIIGGVIPAPLFFWIIWTALFVGYVAWIAYRWDPYAAVARRAEALAAQQNDANGEER
ncbi:hypothetical protein IM660_18080 [Ruania alkalisoli]|uniref:DUF3311 domain-containing protein n=1 Tax=Ruania alkalisoli TaxID=2779775 RepID=A0A7M1SV29_9MICO|nr:MULTISPECIES: hypothetical protein [Ruania]QOR70473.1 hypothetical protein IM660_18080 [Ruania alkalisoli]